MIHRSTRQHCAGVVRRNWRQASVFQQQYTIRAARQGLVMCGQNGGQVVGLVQPPHQLENAFRISFIQVARRLIGQE